MSFAHHLQHARTAKGWTHEQLAAASGVSAVQIARIEHQRAVASEQAMALLLAALEGDALAAPADGAAPQPATDKTGPPTGTASVPTPAPQPVALHLPADLLAQLETAAAHHRRSLHGEIVARLMDSFTGSLEAPATTEPTTAQPVTWSPADLERLTALVAQRLRDSPRPLA